MPALTIDLRSGFYRTPVRIEVDGVEVLRADAVTTRMQTGFAQQVVVDTASDTVRVRVWAGDAAPVERLVDVRASRFLGVDLSEDSLLKVTEQDTPFGYV